MESLSLRNSSEATINIIAILTSFRSSHILTSATACLCLTPHGQFRMFEYTKYAVDVRHAEKKPEQNDRNKEKKYKPKKLCKRTMHSITNSLRKNLNMYMRVRSKYRKVYNIE